MKKPILILICGSSGSGKTTVSKMLSDKLGDKGYKTAIICQDAYYVDVPQEQVSTFNYDDLNAFEWDMLIDDVKQLIDTQYVTIPQYDYSIHKKVLNVVEIKDVDFVIIEGLHTLSQPELKQIARLSLFIDTPKDECLIRRIKRDVNERGRTIDSVANQWLNCVSLMYDKFIAPLKNEANLVIPWSYKNEHLLDFLIPSLIEELSK